MPRVIKPDAMKHEAVFVYQRDSLEDIPPDLLDERGQVDPTVVLKQAREQAEELVREAYEEGLRRGMEAGQKKFDESVAAAAMVLEHTAAELQRARQEFVDSLAPDISDLVATVAQRVVRREATIDPGVLTSTIHAALEKLYDQERVTLRVHPDDLEAMRSQRVEFLEEFKGILNLDVVPSEEVSPGGCIAESARMYLDARLDTQLERVLNALEV